MAVKPPNIEGRETIGLSIPEKLGKYQILSKIGEGAMGIVYKGKDTRLGRLVALKTMSPQVAAAPDMIERFYHEAQSAGQLQHPNIVTIFEIDEDRGTPFIAMQFLEGDTLEKLVSTRQPLAMLKKFDILIQICHGLNYAHDNGIVHRDIKPANIMVLRDGLVKILDFGIARIVDLSMTRTGLVMGTPAYMSPEQILGQVIDGRSDTYSAGIILYELLTFTKPFSHTSFVALTEKIVNQDPPPLHNLLSDCPPLLEKVMARALAKKREDRYEHADDFALDLQQVSDFFGRHQVQTYIEQGRRSMDQGELTVAKESLQRALQIDSSHDLARNLLNEVQEQISLRRRAQKVEQNIRQAKEALRTEQFEEAISLLDDVLELSPGHESARQYRQRAIESRDRVQRIREHMERAEKLVADTSLEAAKEELQAVLALDPQHAGALKLLDWIQQELAAQERQRQVQQLILDARMCVAQSNLDRATNLLQDALRLDPVNIEIETLIRQVRAGQEKEKSRRRRDATLAGIQQSLDTKDFSKAVILADQALEQFPEDAQVLRLQTQVRRLAESDKTRRFVEDQLQAAREFLQQNKHAEALSLLQSALQSAPGDMRLLAFLRSVKESQETFAREALSREALREANRLIRERNFSPAIRAIERAIAQVGELPDLSEALKLARELASEQQAKQRIEQVLSRAERFLLEDSYNDAIQVLEAALREGDSAEISALLATAREQRQSFENRFEQTIERAQQLLSAGDANRALALLEAAPAPYLRSDQFRRLYAQCKASLERVAFIQMTLAQVDKYIEAQDLTKAATLLRQALEEYPGDPALIDAEKRLRSELLEQSRVRWAKQIEEARAAIGQTENRRAIETLQSLPPEIDQFPELASEARGLLEEAERNEKQSELREQAIERANAEIHKGNLASAIHILEGAVALAGESDELLERVQFARTRVGEKVHEILETARKHLNDENSVEAIRLLEQAQRDFVNSEIKDLLNQARAEQRKSDERRAVVLKQAAQLLEAGEAAKAVALLEATPKAYFDHSDFQLVYGRCREGLDRATFVRSTVARVESCLAGADLPQAETMLQQALEKYPDDPSLLAANRRLREEQLRVHQIEWQKSLDESEAAAGRMEYARAVEILAKLPPELADVPKLASRAKALEDKVRREQREIAVRENALREAKARLEKNDYTSAIASLEKAIATAGESPALRDLLKLAQERQRQQHVGEVLTRARTLLREDSYEEAIHLLEKAQGELGNAQIESQLGAAREEWHSFEQRRKEMVQEGARMLAAAEPGRAVAFLDTAPHTYFKDEEFHQLYAQCRQQAERVSAVRTTLGQLKHYLLSENLDQAQALLDSALRAYPDEPNLLEAQRSLGEEQLRLGRRAWAKIIDEAKIAIGRLEYHQAVQILQSVLEQVAEVPELAVQVSALLEEARAGELARQQRVITPPVPPLGQKPRPWLTRTRAATAGVLVLALLTYGAYRLLVPPAPPGSVQIEVAPWAEVVSIQTAGGRDVHKTGQTPMVVELPPGKYVIRLKGPSGQEIPESATVESGKSYSLRSTVSGFNVDAVVDELMKAR